MNFIGESLGPSLYAATAIHRNDCSQGTQAKLETLVTMHRHIGFLRLCERAKVT